MPGEAVRVVELGGEHRRDAEAEQAGAPLGGEATQHPGDR